MKEKCSDSHCYYSTSTINISSRANRILYLNVDGHVGNESGLEPFLMLLFNFKDSIELL